MRLIPEGQRTGRPFLCFVLHHVGFALPPQLPSARWALTPPFHPYLPPHEVKNGGLFSAALSVQLGLHPTVPRFHKARYPMESGLSSLAPKHYCDHPESGRAV